MRLQEFVSQAVKEIIAGVQEAQTYAATTGARINPALHYGAADKGPYALGTDDEPRPIRDVEFDVGVTSTDASETQAGADVFVAVLGIGARGRSDTSNGCVSRIKFSVPIVLPIQGR
jgi:hypothetical protein